MRRVFVRSPGLSQVFDVATVVASVNNTRMDASPSDSQDLPSAAELLHLPPDARCYKCNYLLHGLTEPRCPECGLPFDPTDPLTYLDPSTRLEWWERLGQQPAWWHTFAVLALTGSALYSQSEGTSLFGLPRQLFYVMLLAPLIGIGLVVMYLEYLIAAGIRRGIARDKGQKRGGRWSWQWLVTPLCAVLLVLGAWTRFPLLARFAASRGAFEAAASDVLAGKAVATPGWFGLYHVDRIEIVREHVFFQTGRDLVDPHGFGYFFLQKPDPYAGTRGCIAPRWHWMHL